LTESLLPQKINLDDIFETIYHCKKITEKWALIAQQKE
jgi:hypothetical protein